MKRKYRQIRDIAILFSALLIIFGYMGKLAVEAIVKTDESLDAIRQERGDYAQRN